MHPELESTNKIFLSVIICTYRRPEYLSQVLKSLSLQDWQGKEWEVIVVENDSIPSPAVTAITKEYSVKLPTKIIFEGTPNLSRARNLGSSFAEGEYIAYLDDDAEAGESWLSSVISGCKVHKPDFAGGPVFPLFRCRKPFWFKDSYVITNYYGEKARALEPGEYLSGVNFLVRRELLLKLGSFREDLGMFGGNIWWAEETELLRRAWGINTSLKVQYLPRAVVLHNIRPEKMTLAWQFKSSYTHMKSYQLITGVSSHKLNYLVRSSKSAARLIINLPGLLFVLFLDILRPQKKLWKRYVKERLLKDIVQIYALFF